MSDRPFISRPEDRPQPLNVIGTSIVVLATPEQARDQQITLQSGDEGTGPPPHSHAWDESFYVTRGVVHFVCDGEAVACGPGTLVHVPAGTVHAFQYGAGGGEMLEFTGKQSRAVELFTALDAEIPSGPPDVDQVVGVLARNGVATHL